MPEEKKTKANKSKEIPKCGIVMPISRIEECSEGHWTEVLEIFNEAITEAGFEGRIVSTSDEVGFIHKRIIQNLYEDPIVICDVSCKNPNVMFELGMRLAFDKPTIIIKDDKTSYSFDTSPIEHLEYPRDLRFSKIIEFKEKLAEKIKATYEKSKNDSDFTTFLKHFGEFKIAKIDKKEVSEQEYILEEIRNLRKSISRLDYNPMRPASYGYRNFSEKKINIHVSGKSPSDMKDTIDAIKRHPLVVAHKMRRIGPTSAHLNVELIDEVQKERFCEIITETFDNILIENYPF